ncbi:hypothetical protein [Draconibacterium halophilum]|uniref:Uncharacterized protein n=1 Tax=Draconibacterium halophilum TaxID=2706887 RepID=A0A6C0R8X9_9BACT|nr:hypothetical protein [Draconibacterium halophilum]QIA06557.1 hypothetical protein G0Q07_01900 [Draconibacterium halophilum]
MKLKSFFLATVIIGIVVLCSISPTAKAEKYYDNRDDEWDEDAQCYRQCVADGTSCYYMDDYPYDC